MRRKRNNKKISLIIISIALVFCAVFGIKYSLKTLRIKADTDIPVIVSEANKDEFVPEASVTGDTAAPAQDRSSASVTTAQTTSMPVLMYHYIRDFNDPNDSVGTNLSVSPQAFAQQLDYIKQQGFSAITFNDILSGNIPEKPIILTFDDGYKDFYQFAYPELKKRGMIAVSYVITNKIGSDLYLSRDKIKELAGNGIEIGSHTLSHPDLSKLKTDLAKKEISDSKNILESITGKKVVSLCYPSGKFSTETESLVKNAGYSYAVTTKGGITTFENVFGLNRYRVNHDTSIKNYIK